MTYPNQKLKIQFDFVVFIIIQFNVILKTISFPTAWKLVTYTPIHKSGDKMDMENYRGIAIMCTPDKLFKQIIYSHI